MDFHLTPQQRYRLRRVRDRADDADTFRRTLALLQLDQGLSVATVAAELGATRQSVYNWLDRYLLAPTPRALRDARGHGHVSAWDDDLLPVLRSALKRPPRDWGDRGEKRGRRKKGTERISPLSETPDPAIRSADAPFDAAWGCSNHPPSVA